MDPSRFVRIRRSTIVQVSRIRDLQSLPNRELRMTLNDGTELKVSRTYRERLDRWLAEEAAVVLQDDYSGPLGLIRRRIAIRMLSRPALYQHQIRTPLS